MNGNSMCATLTAPEIYLYTDNDRVLHTNLNIKFITLQTHINVELTCANKTSEDDNE